jgi:hypothetical protein
MAKATLKLTIDPATRKRIVTIGYSSDEDALPHEHEEAHRALVEKIFERGIASPGDTIVVEREEVAHGEGGARPGEGAREKAREGA